MPPHAIAAVQRTLDHAQPAPLAASAALAAAGAAVYGLAMGSFSVTEPARWPFMLFGAIKTPALLVITTLVCLPAYAALLLAAGLRHDLREAIARLVRAQAAGAIALASLAPVVLVAYTGIAVHTRAVLFNAALFTAAAACGNLVAWRLFRPLIARSRRHLALLGVWAILYAFVGIQLGWTLRPFVGTPGSDVQFFREGALTNAYEALWRIVRDAAGL